MINFEEKGDFKEWFMMASNKIGVYYPTAKIPLRFYNDYLANIRVKDVDEVKEMLRILLGGGTFGIDTSMFDYCPELDKYCKENKNCGINYSISSDERYHRMRIGNAAWEGITWGLSFLPVYPIKVIELIQDYFITSIQSMPDDMIDGYYQAIEIIRKRFVDITYPKEIFEALKPYEFERLICLLYNKIGYNTEWTQATRDGGKDIIASKENAYGNEYIYIECKKYSKAELKKETVRAFAYTVLNDKVHKGIIFCTGYVSKTLYEYDQRIEIIDYNKLIELLNSYYGDWLKFVGNEVYNESKQMINRRFTT
ncbi:restriction endonuclease [Ruminiclostridium cellobioparum]|uniref:restriction endonuclease n=1 Tax=Ruminiclostridium cellobioparum TaxID=29355 RepID=UPI00054EB0D5|nr:restriction endonuclease [Ruminiclostridium cellobioparum]